jgi:hypothetical protein
MAKIITIDSRESEWSSGDKSKGFASRVMSGIEKSSQ